jgi:V8-like Glu-specific endopeptidase
MADSTANLPHPEPAMPAPERDGARLADEIAKLAPILYRTDASPQLSAMLNIIARAKTMGQDGYRMLEGFANRLKQLRAFDDLYILTSEMNADGLSSPQTRRLEIQALIELGVFETALDLVRPLLVGDVNGPDDKASYNVREAYGLLGRIYKQMFIESIKPGRKTERKTLELFLSRSFNAYIHVWEKLQNEATAYHAVNALAVAQRAMQQGFADEEDVQEAQKLANDILGVIAKSGTNNVWADATRGEALVALGRHAEAAQAYAEFADHAEVDPFSLGASLRQLEEVWELNGGDPIKGKPVRILKAALLGKLDAVAKANNADGKAPGTLEAVRINMTAAEMKLVDKDLAAMPEAAAPAPAGVSGADSRTLQKTYGINNPIGRRAIRKKLRLSSAVCRIEGPHNGEIKGIGSGFAIRGGLLHEAWGDAPVIITNNHVISSRGAMGGRRPEFCRAAFIADNDEQEEAVKFASVLWESDVEAHDVTILKPAGPLPAGVVPLTELTPGSLGPRAQNDEGIGRCYVIGFPNARELSFSLADNILLDHDAPPDCVVSIDGDKLQCTGVPPLPVRVHYRTPTVEGNSGSPVFDADTISLLGVHHSGDREMRRLNNRGGAYAANEGIWIYSIRQAIATSFAGGDEATGDMPRWWAFPDDGAPRVPKPPVDPGELVVPASVAKPMRIEGGSGEPMPGVSPFAAELIYAPGPAKPEERRSAQLETVIGVDNRTRILDTQMSPWRMVCAIRARWGSRLMVGTGCFIGPDTVLTAGHVVFTREFQRPAQHVEIIPGLSIDRAGVEKRPYEHAMGRVVQVHEHWMSSFSPRFDVAVIKLDRPLGQRVGWFGVESRARENLVNHWAHVSGYPGEMKEERPKGATADLAPQIASQLWHHAAPIEQVENGRMFYKTDTTPGQSGAPVYLLPEERQYGAPLVVGVHAYGARATPGAMGLANSGVWIDGAMFEKIRGWRG